MGSDGYDLSIVIAGDRRKSYAALTATRNKHHEGVKERRVKRARNGQESTLVGRSPCARNDRYQRRHSVIVGNSTAL